MLYADRVIDEFETYDYESLFHVSLKLLEQLKEYYELHYASEDSKLFMFSCVMYFTTLSGYSDGVEQRLVREIFSFNDILSNIEEYRLKIRDNGWFEIVEKTLVNSPSYIKDSFARLGCCIYASKGIISYDERERIKKWL